MLEVIQEVTRWVIVPLVLGAWVGIIIYLIISCIGIVVEHLGKGE